MAVLVKAFTRSLKHRGRAVERRFHCAIQESVKRNTGFSHHTGVHKGTLTILLLTLFLIVCFRSR